MASPSEVMVAARGALYKRASSPNASPGWYFFSTVGVVYPLKTFEQVRVPVPTT